jgi:sorbitol/mannitol transport system substrate-binding protein
MIANCNWAIAETLNIVTVNNADMIVMQQLSPQWEQATGNKLNWLVLEENILRQRVTTDIATKGGQFDVVTIGAYETPIWSKRDWLVEVDDLGDDYDYPDLIDTIKNSLSAADKLYAVPFYGESSFTLYRKDLFEKAGLTMPEQPTYGEIADFAEKLTNKATSTYGICLRGKPGWGENMAFLSMLVHTNGGAWFDMKWNPQLQSEPWKKSINFYVDLMRKYGPPGATSSGFNEIQALFATGHCAMWIDSTVGAVRVFDPKESLVSSETGFARAPVGVVPNGAGWLWSWALAIPASSHKQIAAKSFIKWATSKDYVALVGRSEGWLAAPAGTRKSTYANPEYQQAAPFASIALNAIMAADPANPAKDPVPYTGLQFVGIPEFQAIGTTVGQSVAAALAGQVNVDQALATSERAVEHMMKQAGYIK